jgi:F-type H+-transporting ATPase subunit epsilon
MHMSTLLLEIVTPERRVYAKDVEMVSVKGLDGELGIMPLHVPIVSPLKIAPVRVKLIGGGEDFIAVHGGFVEVRKDKVVILAEGAELSEEIDVDRAERARLRAEQRLSNKDMVDFHRAEIALQRALTRLDVKRH